MKFFLKVFFVCFTILTGMQLQALSRHLIHHHNTFFQQQQPKKNQKEKAKIHANSNSIIGSNNVKRDNKIEPPKNNGQKNNGKEKGNKRKK